MDPNLFRPLDHIDPPDQWDAIAERAASDEVDVRLDHARAPRRRAGAWVAAAAAVAVVAGGIAVARAGGDDSTERATEGPATQATEGPAPGGVAGPCPFTLEGDGLSPVAPFDRGPSPDAFPIERSSTGIVVVDNLEVVVTLGGSALIDGPTTSSETQHRVLAVDTDADTITVSFSRAIAADGPCPDAKAVVDLPLLPEHLDATDLRVRPMGEVLAPYVDAYGASLDRVLDAVTPTGEAGPDACTEPGATCLDEDDIVATGSAMPEGLPIEWEGPLAGGAGTYTIVMDEAGTRAVVGGEAITPADTWPEWNEETESGSGLGFELSPRDAGQPQDIIIVGIVPPDTVETFVVDRNGDPVEVPSLTLSPDGRFYAVHGLDIPDNGPNVWPIRHRLASGEVVPGLG